MPNKEKLKAILLEFLIGTLVSSFSATLLATLRWIVTSVYDYFS